MTSAHPLHTRVFEYLAAHSPARVTDIASALGAHHTHVAQCLSTMRQRHPQTMYRLTYIGGVECYEVAAGPDDPQPRRHPWAQLIRKP